VLDSGSEKVLCLSEQELLRLLEDNVCRLLYSCPQQQVPIGEFIRVYAKTCGGCLCLRDFGVTTVVDLIAKIPYLAKVCQCSLRFRNVENKVRCASCVGEISFTVCCIYKSQDSCWHFSFFLSFWVKMLRMNFCETLWCDTEKYVDFALTYIMISIHGLDWKWI